MKHDKIVRNLLEKAAAEFVELTRKKNEDSLIQSRTTRLAHFEKNYKKK
jgi:hypothetical protein